MRSVPFAFFAVALAACPEDETPPVCAVHAVLLDSAGFFPEGVEVDAAGILYVGSLGGAGVWSADACEAQAEPFAVLQGPTLSAIGLLADNDRGWLWVATGDFFAGADPAVEVFDLQTGAALARHPLQGGFGFPNDLALGPDGSVYVTESFTSAIFRISAAEAGSGTEATLWSAPVAAAPAAGEIGFNGIVADGNALIVAQTTQGLLYSVPIGIDGSAGEAVVLTLDRVLAGPDGLEILPDGRIGVVEGWAVQVSAVDVSAGVTEVVAEGLDYPTTAASDGEALWVVESQLDHLLGIDPAPAEPMFEVVRVAL